VLTVIDENRLKERRRFVLTTGHFVDATFYLPISHFNNLTFPTCATDTAVTKIAYLKTLITSLDLLNFVL